MMNRNKKLALSLGISGLLSFALVLGVNNNDYNIRLFKSYADYDSFCLDIPSFSEDLHKGSASTSLGNSVEFAYDIKGSDNWGIFDSDSYIANTSPISGIQSIEVTYHHDGSDQILKVYYGWSFDFYVGEATITPQNNICYFNNDKPTYFRLESTRPFSIDIDSVSLQYSCSTTEIPEELIGNGLVYEYYNDEYGEYYEVTGIEDKTSKKSVIIPETYNGLPVYSIASRAFRNSNASNIILPHNLKCINGGNGSVLSIGAFYGCCFKNIVIPENVTYIGGCAFANCANLESVYILSNVEYIGQRAFSGCSSLKSISLPDSITTIELRTFSGCTSLENINIPNSVNTIKESAFRGCSSLKSVFISASVTSIEESVFVGCSSLSAIDVDDLNNNYSSIDGVLFNKDKNLLIQYPNGKKNSTFEFPSTVTVISSYAFYSNKYIETIELPDGLLEIGSYAFYYCDLLTNLIIPNSTSVIGEYAFDNCTSLASIVIPNSVTSIGNCAFSECTSLTSIAIPDSVTSIDASVFGGCTSLKSVDIPDSVTYIGEGAFSYCTSLDNIVIPNSVTSIGDFAFSECTSLKSIDIPDSVTYIGEFAFALCTSLDIIVIPSSVTYIGDSFALYCNENLIVYCEASEQPSSWNDNWANGVNQVVWGYTGD